MAAKPTNPWKGRKAKSVNKAATKTLHPVPLGVVSLVIEAHLLHMLLTVSAIAGVVIGSFCFHSFSRNGNATLSKTDMSGRLA